MILDMYTDLLRINLKGFKYYKKSGFKLASGKTSPFYFDVKMAMGNSQIMYEICSEINKKLGNYKKINSVGGIESGSIPIASAFVLYHSIVNNSNINFFYIRKMQREHGTEKIIEGIMKPDAVLLEDVMTRGISVRDAIMTAKENQQKVSLVIPIIFRGTKEDKIDIQRFVGTPIDPIFYEEHFLD